MADFCVAEAFAPVPAAPVVQVVHPSGLLEVEDRRRLREGLRALQAANPRAEIRWDPGAAERAHAGYLAGDDEARLAELVAAIEDDSVDLIWAARGGYGAARIAPQVLAHLEQATARRKPKLLVGFSDITTLLCCWIKVGWPAVHGPVLTSLAPGGPVKVDLERLWAVLTGRRTDLAVSRGPGPVVEGRLVGGNLTVLASLAGSPLLPTGAGHIWVLEDLNEVPYKLDRCLTQLRLAGALDLARPLWLGSFSHKTVPDLDRVVAELCAADLAVAPLLGAPAGHEGVLDPLPLGVPVTLDPQRGRLSWRLDRDHA